jgi:hypothetical protein
MPSTAGQGSGFMSAKAQRACLLCGFGLVVLFFVGFWALAGFLTPPSPMDSGEQILQLFAGHRNRIRTGLMVTMFAAALLVPWSAAMFVQLRRGEGRFSPLPYVQMLCGTLFSLEFIYLIMFWQTAAFREDISPELARTLNDMAWIPFVGLTSTAVVQAFALGFSMLGDQRAAPVFPRWAGYFNVWVALMFTPGSLCVFFKDGPFAYDGVLAWYLPVAVFTVWLPLNTVLCLRAVRAQEAAYAGAPAEVEDLALQLAQVRQELDRVSAAAAR